MYTLEAELENRVTKKRKTLSVELPDALENFIGYDEVSLRRMSTDVVDGGPSSKKQTIVITATVSTFDEGENPKRTEVYLQVDVDPFVGGWDAEDQDWQE